jgi:hypothetical protein
MPLRIEFLIQWIKLFYSKLLKNLFEIEGNPTLGNIVTQKAICVVEKYSDIKNNAHEQNQILIDNMYYLHPKISDSALSRYVESLILGQREY